MPASAVPVEAPSLGNLANAPVVIAGESPEETLAAETVDSLRQAFKSGKTKDVAWRKQQLLALQRAVRENHEEITAAVQADHGGAKLRGFMEMSGMLDNMALALSSLDSWAADTQVEASAFGSLGSSAALRHEPKGVMLIVAPWNYPVAMCFDPLVAALAAGNCVVIKPSEISTNSAACVARLVHEYLDPACVRVIEGGIPITSALLAQRWDHIMYTGNGNVGRVVLEVGLYNSR